jgi:creatinine amidohydrolase/Fe(II)-dependent formamide hydrolase-like protein
MKLLSFLILFLIPLIQGFSQDLDSPSPIPGISSVFMEELTWMEIRDAIKEGKTSVIVATGGIEQNGPFVATGKHNYVLQATTEAIAMKLGNALVAPIIKFVPEGEIDPPSGHMRYPGTISLRKETFKLLITDITTSLKQHGFQNIIFICDSGGNQEGMKDVSMKLNKDWENQNVKVHYIEDYYIKDIWSFDYLKSIGVKQLPDKKTARRQDIHSDYHYESIMAVVNPELIRTEQRMANGLYSINDFDMNPPSKTIENGKKLIEYRANLTVEAIQKSISN